MNIQPFLIGDGWMEMRDGDASCRAIFDRHYSRRRCPDGQQHKLFVGPGEKFVLMTADGGALCVWRKFINRDGQRGVNCAIYRREEGEPASILLRSAMERAWQRWPEERLYTYVDPREVKPTYRAKRPTWGHCFYQAGWKFCGITKKRLHILEALPAERMAA